MTAGTEIAGCPVRTPLRGGVADGPRADRPRQRGSAAGDYLGMVAVIAVLMVSLVMLRPHRAGPKSPVNPITPVVRILGHTLETLEPKPPPVRRPATSPRPRPRRPARPRVDWSPVTVLLPEWWTRS